MTTSAPCSPEQMNQWLVRYDDLIPCTDAFLDRRIDGRTGNENFTIIGPGVSESPDQHVHIARPHGFNIGGARQEPHAINSQHSHLTAEVFVVHSGRWAFRVGHDGQDGEVVLEPGDAISIPINIFRGFENVADESGYLFAVLGGDDPGRVTWAPDVFERASATGLVLLENGMLIDLNAGETIPDDLTPTTPTTMEEVAQHRRIGTSDLEACVVRRSAMTAADTSVLTSAGTAREMTIIGAASAAEGLPQAPLCWEHGFSLRAIDLPQNSATVTAARQEEEVLFVHAGAVRVAWPEGELTLYAGDVLSVPIGVSHRIEGVAEGVSQLYVVRRGDVCSAPQIAA